MKKFKINDKVYLKSNPARIGIVTGLMSDAWGPEIQAKLKCIKIVFAGDNFVTNISRGMIAKMGV